MLVPVGCKSGGSVCVLDPHATKIATNAVQIAKNAGYIAAGGGIYCPMQDRFTVLADLITVPDEQIRGTERNNKQHCGLSGGKFSTFQKAKVPYKRTFTDRKCVLAFLGFARRLAGTVFLFEI